MRTAGIRERTWNGPRCGALLEDIEAGQIDCVVVLQGRSTEPELARFRAADRNL
jgi:hypothetical protein